MEWGRIDVSKSVEMQARFGTLEFVWAETASIQPFYRRKTVVCSRMTGQEVVAPCEASAAGCSLTAPSSHRR